MVAMPGRAGAWLRSTRHDMQQAGPLDPSIVRFARDGRCAAGWLFPLVRTCGGQQLRAGHRLLNSGGQRCHASPWLASGIRRSILCCACCATGCSRLPSHSAQAARSAATSFAATSLAAAAASAASPATICIVATGLARQGQRVSHAKLRLELQGGAQSSQSAGGAAGDGTGQRRLMGQQLARSTKAAVPLRHPPPSAPAAAACYARGSQCKLCCPASPPSVCHDGDCVGQQVCLFHRVSRQQHRGACLCPPPLDYAPSQPAIQRIAASGHAGWIASIGQLFVPGKQSMQCIGGWSLG